MRRLATIAVIAALALAAVLYLAAQTGAARRPKAAIGSPRPSAAKSSPPSAPPAPINPITTVIVGSQLSGQVVEILADYNSEVKADQVVARLNSDQIRAKLDAARADLDADARQQARAARP